ncbi:MAG: hypothetical protein SF339_15930 [Blastocatellia bacterium]|nr:hypothetical protein [Blastocatellia bacterium]
MYLSQRQSADWRAVLIVWALLILSAHAQSTPQKQSAPASQEKAKSDAAAPPAAPPAEGAQTQRTQLNLLGQTDAASGESRRNENVQFNLIDNNSLRELNLRVGTTATLTPEFGAARNYFGAEYGNPPSPSVHLPGVKTGGIHGSVFETHNNSVFSARAFFQVGGVKPARENNYGFNLGAPLSDRTWLLLDASQQKVRGVVNGNVLVPRADERTPLAADPALRRIVERFLAAYPNELPNRTDIDPRALNTNAPQRIDTDNVSARLDHTLNSRDRLALRYAFTGQVVNPFQFIAGQNPDTFIKSHNARITWHRAWSANLVGDFTLGFDRTTSLLRPEKNAVGPSVQIGGAITGLGPPPPIPIDRALNTFRHAAALQNTRGNHRLSFGAELFRTQINGSEPDGDRGILAFANDGGRDALTNFRLGLPIQYTLAVGNTHRGFRNWVANGYVGDNWRASNRLQFSLGLRYQIVTRPTEVNGLNAFPFDCDCNNAAPYFGFAYRLSEKLGIVRANYGLHYGQIFPVTYGQIRLNPPGSFRIFVGQPNLLNPLGNLDIRNIPANTRSSTFAFSPDFVTPYAHQYNFRWEPVVAKHVRLQLGYVGSRAHKLFQMWFGNRAQIVPGIAQTTATVNQRRPDPNVLEGFSFLNASRGWYDAARVSVVLTEWAGLSLDASYWFSKSLDLGHDYTNTLSGPDGRVSRSQTEFDVQRDLKGRSGFDQPHALLTRASWRTPGLQGAPVFLRGAFRDWNFSAVTLLKNGTPFSVESGSDAPGFGNVDGSSGDRPNLLDVSLLGRTIGNPDTSTQLLPRAAFQFIQPTAGAGTLGRNVFRRGKIANVNASLTRTWTVRAPATLTFRAESINLFNTPQFAEPTRELTSPSFGRITNTLNDGRTFRFTLRLNF